MKRQTKDKNQGTQKRQKVTKKKADELNFKDPHKTYESPCKRTFVYNKHNGFVYWSFSN
jgi:hypothetical protein